jgi:hypothetical protein
MHKASFVHSTQHLLLRLLLLLCRTLSRKSGSLLSGRKSDGCHDLDGSRSSGSTCKIHGSEAVVHKASMNF